MSYPEPSQQLGNLKLLETLPQKIAFLDSNNLTLEISYFKNIGWQLEVRYDLMKQGKRQPFTGAQDSLVTEALSLLEARETFTISSSTSQLKINKTDSSFQITENGRFVFHSSPFPFSSHKEPIDMYEKLVSRRDSDFASGASFVGKGQTFKSHMLRFQYPRPKGLILGIPGQTGEMNRNGYRFELYNTDSFLHIPDRNPLYESWPILFHQTNDKNGWVGIFHDNPSRTFIDIGDFYHDSVTFESQIGNSRVFIVSGKTLQNVSQKMVTLLGKPVFPPLWAFGYQQSRWSYMDTKELRSVITKMHDNGYSFDSIYLDIDFMDDYKVFTVNPKRFADLSEFIQEAKQNNVHSVCIVDPGIKIAKDYAAYTELMAFKGYLKTENGEPLTGTVWPGEVIFPDFFNDKTKEWWSQKTSDWLRQYSFDGLWNDMNEPSDFIQGNKLFANSYSAHGSFRDEYNLYGYNMAQTSRAGWNKYDKNKRGLVITRSGYPGVQQYATIWHGDNQPWWEHLRLAIRNAINYALCGAFYTGADVPGFFGNTPDDLAIRFYQLGAFLPFFRGHTANFTHYKEPYMFTKTIQEQIKKTLYLRYSLLREWYSGFEYATRENISPLVPVLSSDSELIQDEYILFNKLLFAPVVERDQRKKLIYLPEGTWFELGNTKKSIPGDQWITQDITLETVPVYVRAGTILTRNTPGKNTVETFENPEKYETYLDDTENAEGYWFDDDGISTKSKTERIKLIWQKGKITKQEIPL